MINLILLFPFLACLILYVFKKDTLTTWMLNIYAILHLLVSVLALYGIDLLPAWKSSSFFAIKAENIVFLL
jgi:hypothetical protein